MCTKKMKKRIIVATVSGFLCSIFCMFADQSWGLAQIGSTQMPWRVVGQIICSRTLIGFAIGISCLNLRNWAIHGAVMGIIFSSPLAFSCLITPESGLMLFAMTWIFGIIYGLFVEFITTVIFKAPQKLVP